MVHVPSRPHDEPFRPKLVTVLAEGYGRQDLRADAFAGITVAVVALPLSLAIAIASGLSPVHGLAAAIVGGFLVSGLGGSRFQVGGPAGAFIVLVAACVAEIGVAGMLLATLMSGLFLLLVGLARLGTYVKYVPYPVTVGFTAGIAVIILASQVAPFFGLTLSEGEPSAVLPKVMALWQARATWSPAAVAVAVGTVVTIVVLKRLRPHWPTMLIAVGGAAVAAAVLGLPVETLGSRFGEMPRSLAFPGLPEITPASLAAALPFALSFTLLGAIESLLSAVVADGMTGRRHRSNVELAGQGVANVATALCGGMPVTGTIARTATNVRAGARTPVAGMIHAVVLLGFMLLAAPLVAYIPLAALAGVLAVVAWGMMERDAVATLLRSSRADAVVVASVFLLTIFRDLTEAIIVGIAFGALLFIRRMSDAVAVEPAHEVSDHALAADPDLVVYRVKGAFFFAAAATVGSVLERIADRHRAFIVDFEEVPFIDSTGARAMELLLHKAERQGVRLALTGLGSATEQVLATHGVAAPRALVLPTIADAVAALRQEKRPPRT
jgi:sulfate permease, SulP family